MTYFKGQKENPPAMEDFDDLTQSSETSSEYGKFPCSNYEATLKLIEHLSLECKGKPNMCRRATAVYIAQHCTPEHCCILMRGRGMLYSLRRMGIIHSQPDILLFLLYFPQCVRSACVFKATFS